MMNLLRCTYFLLLTTSLSAQQDLSGSWSGLLLQNEGGISDRFELFFDLQQIGMSIQGTAFVRLGELQAQMRLSGFQTPDGSWRISETRILRSNKAGLSVSWCMKEYDLRVDYQNGELILTGPWWGNSEYGPCIPGSITLRRGFRIAGLLFFRGEHPVDVETHGEVHYGHYAFHRSFAVRRDEHAVAAAGPGGELGFQVLG